MENSDLERDCAKIRELRNNQKKNGEKVVTNVENDSINNDKDYKIGDDKKKVDKKGKKIILGHVENELEKVNGKLKCYN